MHGILATGNQAKALALLQNEAFGLRDRIVRIPKYARLIPQYISAIAADDPRDLTNLEIYHYLLRLATRPGTELNCPKPSKDIWSDLALAYADVYADAIVNDLHYPRERVTVVGNPNLDAAFALLARPDRQEAARAYLTALGVSADREAIVYLEDCFVEMGHWTEAERVQELTEVAAAARASQLDLVIKYHPSADPRAAIKHFAADPDVHVIEQANLALLAYGCTATVGHSSTTLLLPIVLGRPLLLPAWSPRVSELHFFREQGVAHEVPTMDEMQRLLSSPQALEDLGASSRRDMFIHRYVTRTDGRSQERIADAILSLAKDGLAKPARGVF